MLRGYNWRSLMDKPEHFFVIVAALFGLLFIILTPPLQGPDEQAHFAQVYRYSEGRASSTSDLPKGVVETYKEIFYQDDIRFQSNEKYELGRSKHALLNIPLEKQKRVDGAPYTGTGYSAIAYSLNIMFVGVGKALDLPAVLLVYLARLGSLITYIILMYLAIRLIPVAKVPFMVVGVLPMALFTSSMVSSDAVTIGTSGLFVASILYVVCRGQAISKKDYTLLALTTVGIMLTKLVNVFLLPLLILLIFKKNTVGKKLKPILLAVSLILLGLFTLMLMQVAAVSVPADSVSNIPKNVIPSEQVKLILISPHKFIFALWNTYFYEWGNNIFSSLIGNFGWVDTPMSLPFVITGYAILLLSLLPNRKNDADKIRHLGGFPKLGVFITLIGYIVAVNAGMFIYYSPVDYNIIVGLQGRYFIPALFILSLVTINRRIQTDKSTTLIITRILPVVLLFVSCVYICVRYYVDTRI